MMQIVIIVIIIIHVHINRILVGVPSMKKVITLVSYLSRQH